MYFRVRISCPKTCVVSDHSNSSFFKKTFIIVFKNHSWLVHSERIISKPMTGYSSSEKKRTGISEIDQFCFVPVVPPKISNISSDITVNEGSNVTLVCMANGRPEPVITWRHLTPTGRKPWFVFTCLSYSHILLHFTGGYFLVYNCQEKRYICWIKQIPMALLKYTDTMTYPGTLCLLVSKPLC